MMSTWVKRSHRDWTSITPRKAAKMYQVANWCLRSSGSFGVRLPVLPLPGPSLGASLYPSNFRNRQPGVDFSMSFDGRLSMSVSVGDMSHIAALTDPSPPQQELYVYGV